ncbi:MAG TPA: hypothetical protein VMT46_07110, partial [Anaerolineaceae bacterium]|nr:hypothetical protein [Anaerolineaceae bacterium]
LTRVRKARNLTLAAAARETNLEAHILKKLETGSQEEGAGTLNDLIQYSEFLGVSLKSCIEVASSPQDWESVEVKKQESEVIMRKRKPIIRSVDRVDDLAEKILAKVTEFKQSGKPITREAITRAMGLKSIHPHGKPDVVQALREIRQAHQEQVWGANREKEGEMLHRVEQMIPLVIQQKGHLEITALCRLAGIDRNLIRRSLPLRRVLARFAEKSKPCLEEMVQQAIWDLQLKNRRLTQTAIARKVGYSARGLLKNPKVYSIFVQYGLVKVSTKEEVAIKSDGIVYNGSSFYG